MKGSQKKLLVLAGILIVVGGVFALIGVGLGGMKPVVISGVGVTVIDAQTTTKVDMRFDKLKRVSIEVEMVDLSIQEGDSYSLKGSYVTDIEQIEVTEHDGALTITGLSYQPGFSIGSRGISFGIGFQPHAELVLTYPRGTVFDEVSVHNALGSLRVEGLAATQLTASLDMGSFNAKNIKADSLDVTMNLGACSIEGLTIVKQGKISMNLGSLSLRKAQSHNLTVKSDMGSVYYQGSLTGKADMRLDLGGLDIRLDNRLSDLSYAIKTDLGSVKIDGRDLGSFAESKVSSASCILNVDCNLGSVTLNTQ